MAAGKQRCEADRLQRWVWEEHLALMNDAGYVARLAKCFDVSEEQLPEALADPSIPPMEIVAAVVVAAGGTITVGVSSLVDK